MFKKGDILVHIENEGNFTEEFVFMRYIQPFEEYGIWYDCEIKQILKNVVQIFIWDSISLWYKSGRKVLIESERQLHEF